MNGSSVPFQNVLSFLFYIVLYIPFNIFFMVVVGVLFTIINKLLHLNFPGWVLAIAAALFVFVIMFAFIETSSGKKDSAESTIYYATTIIINLLVLILLLTITSVSKFIFSHSASAVFIFEKPQIFVTIIYVLLTGFFAAIPSISDAKGYMTDAKSEKEIKTLTRIIDTNNIEEFTEANENNFELWALRLPGEQRSLLEYLVVQNKTALVRVSTKNNKELFTYSSNWEIKSQAMLQMLVENGMDPNKAINLLTATNQTELVKIAVEKYGPDFTNSVSYITQNVLEQKDATLLDYLIKHGLCNDLKQSSETICWFVEKNDEETVKMLVRKGFKIDTFDNRMIYWANYNNNLSLLKFLFIYPFDVNAASDEYTNLENAIISGHEAIFDFLLTKKPDVTTLHVTKLNGETNALLIAEKYKQVAMLEKLKRYVVQK